MYRQRPLCIDSTIEIDLIIEQTVSDVAFTGILMLLLSPYLRHASQLPTLLLANFHGS
jgi:hypothetical protein